VRNFDQTLEQQEAKEASDRLNKGTQDAFNKAFGTLGPGANGLRQ
jgi:hypothetical protein